jgi:hypothetical protein
VRESWTSHLVAFDGKPAAIFVDASFVALAPITSLPELVMCHLQVTSVRENGLPSEEAFEAIYALEEKIREVLPNGSEHVYVGRYADSEQAIFHIYARHPKKVIATIESNQAQLPLAPFGCRQQSDPNWEVYLDVLAPTEADTNTNQNEAVRVNLREHGDDCTKPRQIDHYAYFTDRSARKSYIALLRAEGFVIADAPFFRRDGKFPLVFGRMDKPIDIDPTTLMLAERARDVNGDYDGWDCPVIRPDNT